MATASAKSMRQLKEAVFVIVSGSLGFCGYSIYEGNERFYRERVMPLFRYMDPETTHNLAIFMAKYKLVPKPKKPDPPSLNTRVFGKEFSNPVGVAAGFDKQGEATDGMLKTGFGFVEVGTVTPKPQPGNPKPRLFRLWEDNAVINRFGFNSDGHNTVYERLQARRNNNSNKHSGLVGVNLGKNKVSDNPVGDYVEGVQKFGDIADYLVVNISSPNTPGLRDMQGREQLEELVEKVSKQRDQLQIDPKPPLLVKIAPDLTAKDKQDITEVIMKKPGRVDGLIVSNTTVSRPESLKNKYQNEAGGLSGEPLKNMATQTVKDMYTLTKGEMPIIGVGGISTGQDAYDKIRAGASLVQLYSALVYQGPPVVSRVKRELADLLKKDGFTSISEAIGKDASVPK